MMEEQEPSSEPVPDVVQLEAELAQIHEEVAAQEPAVSDDK